MAQFYTLEEAARVLGMSPDELKQKAQHREVRAFQDRGDWQFRKPDIDELARQRGMGSDPDLSLSDLDLDIPQSGESGSDEINLSEFQLGVARSDTDQASQELLAHEHEGDVEIEETALPPDLTGSSSTIIGMKPMGKEPSDSDVKLVPDDAVSPVGPSASDSDVRLSSPLGIAPSDSDVTLVADDTSVEIPVAKSKSRPKPALGKKPEAEEDDPGATTLRPSPAMDEGFDDPGATTLRPSPSFGSGSSAEINAATPDDSDSDFELTPSSVIDALQPDSGSDFELTALDASDEFDAPTARGPSDSDVTGIEPSASGVNLGRPSDSGINLVTGGFDLDSADSIELAPLDEDEVQPQPKAKPAPKPKPELAPESDPSATALPMKSPVEKDIFDDTDFEVDALESGEDADDRTMQLDATSDFDIDDNDSASEVFAMDEEDVDQNAATAMASAPDLDDAFADSSEEVDVSNEMEADDAWGDVAEDVPAATPAAATAAPAAATAVAAAPRGGTLLTNQQGPEWGGLWVGMLAAATVFMMLLAFVGLDLVTNLYEFRGDMPSSGLVKTIAGLMGGS